MNVMDVNWSRVRGYRDSNVHDEDSSSCDSDGFHFDFPTPDNEPQIRSKRKNKVKKPDVHFTPLSKTTIEDNGKEITFNDTYLDLKRKKASSALPNADKDKFVNEVMKKSVIGPEFETLHSVPPYKISKRQLLRENKKKRESSKGEKWFNMPAATITEEIKNDLQVLQMRSVLDPKQFYKKNALKDTPKFFHVGTVVESPADFYSSRIPKKQRKKTMVDELLADAEFQQYNKQRYVEITQEKKKTTFKAYKHANRLKRKGKSRK